MAATHALYRFFDAEGELLYVGITMNPAARWPKHRGGKPWWAEVTDITLETFQARAEALAAERQAIKTEHPRYNIMLAERVHVPTAATYIKWDCDHCGGAISDDAGAIGVSEPDLRRHETELDAWQAKRATFGLVTPGALLITYPEPARWLAYHFDDECVFDEVGSCYEIPVERIRTPAEALGWTAHLMGKRWLSQTNWESIIRRLGSDS